MCGIAGILDPRGVDGGDVQKMADAIAHRGPDDATTHVEAGVGFGFRRLAIIDLATGRQPIPNEDESVWVMLNGEIYNYRELRVGLEARGHRFRSESDTEVLVHLYEEHGMDLVHHLRGMFAFAIWDRRLRRLVLARDHLGQKPLYWARRGERLYFASEIKAILAVAPEFRALDPLALHVRGCEQASARAPSGGAGGGRRDSSLLGSALRAEAADIRSGCPRPAGP